MGNKLSLLLAAAMLTFVFQTASAAENRDDMDRNDDAAQEFACPMMDGVGMGRGMMMGRRGMRQGMRQGGCGMMGRRGGMGGMGMMGMGFGMMRRLDLTPEQQKQMVDAMAENYRDRLLARIELDEAFTTLRALRDADSADADAVIAANQAVGAATGKLDVLSSGLREKIRSILTPEQLKQAEEMQGGMRGRRGDRDRRWNRGGTRGMDGMMDDEDAADGE